MAEKERSFGNWTKNVVKAPGRVWYTGVLGVSDSINTITGFGKDIIHVVKATKDKIVDCFSPDKKWYQKVLNTPVAAGVGLVGAIEAVVKPIANGLANSGKTLINLGTNTLKSTFGSVFSAKPVSDFSFNTIKTKKKTIHFDTEKHRLNTHEPWTANRGAGSKNTIGQTAAVAGAAAATAAVASAAGSGEVARLKENIKNLNNQIADLQKRLVDALNVKKPESKVSKDTPKSTIKDTSDDAKITVTKAKEEDKGKTDKGGTKGKEEKVEKGEGKGGKSDDAKEKTDDKKGKESLDTESKRKGLGEANDLLKDSPYGQKIMEGLCKRYENFGIIFDDTTSEGHHNKDSITVGTKMPKDGDYTALAPFNRDIKDKKYQTKHVLLHELAHCTVNGHMDTIPEIKKGLDIIKKYIEKDGEGRTLSTLTYKNNVYKSNEAKAKEDLVEMFALRMNGNGTSCKKYMKLLSSNEDEKLREKYGLVTVSKDDADKLQQICDAMAKYYE